MSQYATITFIGPDRSGVVAAVTQALFRLRANIESLEEQVARGEFRMTLMASWKKSEFDRDKILKEMGGMAGALKMSLKVHFMTPGSVPRMAVLVTRESHVLETLIGAIRRKQLKASAVVVISNYTTLRPLAAKAGIPFVHIEYSDRAKAEARILDEMEKHQVDFIVLARFMKILSPGFVWRWKNKIINIHPSLLPAFPGASAYRQAYEKGVKVIGVTSHFVTPNLDEGPIIWQEAFKVKNGEPLPSIVSRGQACEAKCLLKAVRLFLQRKLDVHWGKVYAV